MYINIYIHRCVYLHIHNTYTQYFILFCMRLPMINHLMVLQPATIVMAKERFKTMLPQKSTLNEQTATIPKTTRCVTHISHVVSSLKVPDCSRKHLTEGTTACGSTDFWQNRAERQTLYKTHQPKSTPLSVCSLSRGEALQAGLVGFE